MIFFSPSSRCQLRLAQLGHGPVQRVVVGLFVHMLARYSQRGSRRRQTGAMVCRLRVRTAGLSASVIVRLKMAPPRPFCPSGHHFMTQTAPGKLGTGPGGPAGPPYGRTEYGRSRRRADGIPGVGKGLTPLPLGTRIPNLTSLQIPSGEVFYDHN